MTNQEVWNEFWKKVFVSNYGETDSPCLPPNSVVKIMREYKISRVVDIEDMPDEQFEDLLIQYLNKKSRDERDNQSGTSQLY